VSEAQKLIAAGGQGEKARSASVSSTRHRSNNVVCYTAIQAYPGQICRPLEHASGHPKAQRVQNHTSRTGREAACVESETIPNEHFVRIQIRGTLVGCEHVRNMLAERHPYPSLDMYLDIFTEEIQDDPKTSVCSHALDDLLPLFRRSRPADLTVIQTGSEPLKEYLL